MSTEDNSPLDRAIDQVRSETPDEAVISRAAGQVWARVSAEADAGAAEVSTIRGCADFQALIPAWREGKLSEARILLLKDHTHECPACRKALAGVKPAPIPITRRARPLWQWAAAAAVAATVLIALYVAGPLAPGPGGVRATVASADGILYNVAAGANTPLTPGAPITASERVRTAKGAHAVVRLADGSLVEMRERTEFSVTERRDGTTIHLAGGNIIVQAAKQRSRHLFVATDDCLVSVTGTVFSVNHGIKGSRVAVIEGEVHVSEGKETHVLHPGEQTVTGEALDTVPVEQEIAWSKDVDRYAAVLGELAKFQKKLEAVPGPGLRYSSRLLELVPAGTTFYAAVPNLGPTVAEANKIFQEQLQQSPALQQWWSEKMKSEADQAAFNDALDRIRAFSDYLGPELVVAMAGGKKQPVVLAEVMHSGFREFLAAQLAKVPPGSVRIIDSPQQAAAGTGHELLIYAGRDLVVASTDLALIQQVAAAAASGTSAFAPTAFHAQLAASYRNGAGWLLAADLAPVMPAQKVDTGFGDLRYIIAERRNSENRAVLSFSQPRHGAASWLAAPAASRALNYVSADATFVVAAVVKNPAQMLDDVASMTGTDFWKGTSEFEAQTGVSVRELAQAIGGEFAFAVDGPVLPMPSWKVVLEVYNPSQFQQALEKFAAAARTHGQQITLTSEKVGSQTFYTLAGIKGVSAHYTYQDGFLVAAPSRELVVRALQYPASGYALSRSDKFRALLPKDGQTGFSAVLYHTIGSMLAPLTGAVPLTPEQRKSLEAVASAATPALVVAYGGPDRIELASSGSFFGLSVENLLGLHLRGEGARMKARKGKTG